MGKLHTQDERDQECEHRANEKGAWAVVRRNAAVVGTILTVGAILMAIIAWRDGKRDDLKAGVEAAAKVQVIEKEYVRKKELDTITTHLHSRIEKVEVKLEKMGDKFDNLKDVILERLPDKPAK